MVAGESPRVAERPDAFDVDADLAELANRAERESARVAEIEEERGNVAGFGAPAWRYQPGLSVFSVLERQLAGRDPQVVGEETSQRDAGAAEPGARLRADESFGPGPFVGTQECAAAALVTGREVDSPDVKIGPRQPRRTGARGPFTAAQRAAYQSSVDWRPSRSVKPGS